MALAITTASRARLLRALLPALAALALAACSAAPALPPTSVAPATSAPQDTAPSPYPEPDTVAPNSAASPYPAPDRPPILTPSAGTPVYGYRVVNTYPHNPESFTQGLIYADGALYEGTGQYGQSRLLKVDLQTGEALQSHDLASDLFGEGITLLDGEIYQITWQSRVGFVYNQADFSQTKTFTYTTEGWGITHDGSRLIMSDGTSTLYTLDPETLEQRPLVEVTDENGPVSRLNELEYIDGKIYANIWMTDRIAQIDPQTGRVTAWVDLTGLLPPEQRRGTDAVLNGIAYDPATKRLFVTGKLWPSLFEIELVPAPGR
ncbi:MAG TPA: glutaminyl-peptide cyclotransferase [Roseiflexaceae bacterium]|nr:glutaminyl-peptide cyclotransferase [Roseiflexaceae bacterium]